MEQEIKFNPKKPTKLRNMNCPYCGKIVAENNKSLDHVIAKKFVPIGAMLNVWNLHVNCCVACNNKKSELEDDISSITQLCSSRNDIGKDIVKKALNSFSRKTKKRVLDSVETCAVNIPFNNMSIGLKFIANPQIDRKRVNDLAAMHMQAFYYCLSYDSNKRIGYFWPGVLLIIKSSTEGDWGNETNIRFANICSSWKVMFNCTTANGNFKCIIRKNDNDNCVWAWALEWNQYYRIIGFIGAKEDVIKYHAEIGEVTPEWIIFDANEQISIKEEIPINMKDDILFKTR